MKKYIIRDRYEGNEIARCNTFEEAQRTIKHYEIEDRQQGMYEENFYEIVEGE